MKFGYIVKILLFLILVFNASCVSRKAQKIRVPVSPEQEFTLTYSTYNWAEMIYNGATTYRLTENSLIISNKRWGEKTGRIIYSRAFDTALVNVVTVLKSMRLDSLKDFYNNFCVLTTSGDEDFLTFQSDSTRKSIHLHHYYLKQMEDIVQMINVYTPEKYKSRYLSKNTEQDCWQMILDSISAREKSNKNPALN